MSDNDEDIWAEGLKAWRREYWTLQREASEAWRERSKDEGELQMARKAFEQAKAKFEASDGAARRLQKKIDEMRLAGRENGFGP